jgi:hypothetical protein
MEAQNRLVSRPTRPLAFGITLAVALVVAVLALVVATVLMQGAGTSATSPQVLSTSSDRQAPDAKERNDIYAAALAERFKNQSPDAQERNERTSGR